MRRDYGSDINVFVNRGNQGHTNERKYIINAKWWQKWCDYIGFETN